MADKKQHSIALALSQDELLVVLRYLNAKHLAGLEVEGLKQDTEENFDLAMAVAERALIARGLLGQTDENKMELSPYVFAVVGACAWPEMSVIISRHETNHLEENYFFHTSRRMHIAHTVPITMIHHFLALEDRSNWIKSILSALSLNSEFTNQTQVSAVLPMKSLADARETAIQGGGNAALEMLVSHALEGQSAECLSRALAQATSNTVFSFIDHGKDHVEGFSLMQTPDKQWLIEPLPGSNEHFESVRIQTVSEKEIIQKVKSLLS